MKTKTTIMLVVAGLICLLTSNNASAISIGAGPSTIDFGKMVRGGYAEQVITVGTSGSEDLTCTVELTGNTKDWITIDKGTAFILPANGRVELKAIIQPKEDATIGKYDGAIYIKAAPTSNATSGAGLTVGAGIKIRVYAEITGEETSSFKLRSVGVSNTEIGYPIKFTAVIANTGNVKVTPEIKVEIYDTTGNLKKTATIPGIEILPTVEALIPLNVPSQDLDSGKYTAKIIAGTEEQTATFSILEKGTLALQGVLKMVSLNKIWAETGEPIKITGEAENTGQIPIDGAKLNVEVYLIDEQFQTEKLVKTFQSDETLSIPVGGTIVLTSYYTPTKAGRYTISGALAYSGKKTMAKATILNVIERPVDYRPHIAIAVIIILGGVYWLTRKGEDGRTRRFKKIWGNYLEIK